MKRVVCAALISFLLPTMSLADGQAQKASLDGYCRIAANSGSRVIRFSSRTTEKLMLGYLGQDGGEYKISIANNSNLATEYGIVAIGFSRLDSEVRNPPELCPTAPEEARVACEERNRNNEAGTSAISFDRFVSFSNEFGYVDAEIGPLVPGAHVDPDGFKTYRFKILESALENGASAQLHTPVIPLGGTQVDCVIRARRI